MEIIIIGAGDIGYQSAHRFSKEKHNIALIESNEALANLASDSLDAFMSAYPEGIKLSDLTHEKLDKLNNNLKNFNQGNR